MGKRDTRPQFGIIQPVLYFTPYAWAKIIYLANKGDTEIGAFGFSKRDDPLTVTNVFMVKQSASSSFVEFDKDDIGVFADKMVDEGHIPAEFGRIWIHTHPGNCPKPSGTDESVFDETFGKCSWSIMAIFCRDGTYYARLQYKQPRASVEMKVDIDYEAPFGASDHVAWDAEYAACLSHRSYATYPTQYSHVGQVFDSDYLYNGGRVASRHGGQSDGSPFPGSYVPLGTWRDKARNQNNGPTGNGHLVKVVEGVKKSEDPIPEWKSRPAISTKVEKFESDPNDLIPITVEDVSVEAEEVGEITVLEDPTSDAYKQALMAQLDTGDEETVKTEEKKNDRSKEEVQQTGGSSQIGFTARSSGDSDRGWSSR